MDPMQKYPILRTLLSGLRRSQQKTIALMVAALLEAAQANSMIIASYVAQWLGTQVASAWVRFYRMLKNPRIDEQAITTKMLQVFVGVGNRLLIAIDWTEWHPPLRMLLASVVVGRRAIPISAATFHKQDMPRSQNCRENTFLRVLVAQLNQLGQRAVFLCDRGFRRVSWVQLLLGLEQDFVVRLMADVTVHHKGRQRLLRNWHLRRGQAVDLGFVPLRSDGKVVARMVGVWAPKTKEP